MDTQVHDAGGMGEKAIAVGANGERALGELYDYFEVGQLQVASPPGFVSEDESTAHVLLFRL